MGDEWGAGAGVLYIFGSQLSTFTKQNKRNTTSTSDYNVTVKKQSQRHSSTAK